MYGNILSARYCDYFLVTTMIFFWMISIIKETNPDAPSSNFLVAAGQVTANISQSTEFQEVSVEVDEQMNLWMSFMLTLSLFVVFCFFNVARIATVKRNIYIQTQRKRKEKVQEQMRSISEMLQQIVEKVQETVFPQRKLPKERVRRVRPAVLRKGISLRRKRRNSMRRLLKQKLELFIPLPSGVSDVTKDTVTSHLVEQEKLSTATNSVESQECSDVSSQFSYGEMEYSCSSCVSAENSSLICDDSTEAFVVTEDEPANKYVDLEMSTLREDDAAGDHGKETSEVAVANFPDKNLLGLVRLELGPITQESGYQGREYADSASDGCWSPSKLRSGNSTARSKCDPTCSPALEISPEDVTMRQVPAAKVQKLVAAVEGFNAEMDAALPQLLQTAQTQIILEMKQVKDTFQLPEEKHEFSTEKIYACHELQRRSALCTKISSQINRMEKQIRQTKRACKQLTKDEPKPEKVDKERQFKIALAWEYKHYDRFHETRKNIVKRVKSAMEMHWNCSVHERREPVAKPPAGKALCYECASGRHKLYEIAGLDELIAKTDCSFLSEQDGFDEACPVVALVNCWCDEILKNCKTNRDKADKLEKLLRRVLKEFYSKRFLQRGQLFSQVYRTIFT